MVRVTGSTGQGVSGVAVTFSVVEGGGSAEFTDAVTTPLGFATSGEWILGEPGPQSLRAHVEGAGDVIFRSLALGVPAKIEAVRGDNQLAEVATDVAVPAEVLVTDSAGRRLQGIEVFWKAEGGGTLADSVTVTDENGSAVASGWAVGEAAGTYRLLASLPDSGVTGSPVTFVARARPGAPAQINAVQGNGQASEVDVPVGINPQAKVTDRFGNGVGGVLVRFVATAGGGRVTGADALTDSAGLASPQYWFLGPVAGVTNTLDATAKQGPLADTPVSFTAEGTAAVYDIQFDLTASEELTDAQRAAFDRTEQFWESAIGGNLPWVEMAEEDLEKCLAKVNLEVDVVADRVVDDLLIYAGIYSIDGPGGILGFAGPCHVRAGSSLPIVGVLGLDIADAGSLEVNGHVEGTIVHEVAHVLGFGTLWTPLELLLDSVKFVYTGKEDPHFIGPGAIAAFDDAGGANYVRGKKVPVERLGGPGTHNGHWRDFVFREELMTGWINGGVPNPLSVVTLASLQDLGYEGVDLTVAQPYRIRDLKPTARYPVGDNRIYLGNDILRTPIGVVDRDGVVLRYLRPRS